MARIGLVGDRRAGLGARVGFWFTGRALARLTGQRPVGALDPLRAYARSPRLMRGYAGLEQATAGLSALPRRARALAELWTAALIGCPFCLDLGSAAARRWGITDAELGALPRYRTDPLFDEGDRAVLAFAEAMTATPTRVTDQAVTALRAQLDDDQLLELAHVIALENLRGRFNLALGIESAGFSVGAVCVAPAGSASEDKSS